MNVRHDPQMCESRLRLEWAKAAVFALDHCRPEHADAICCAWLEAAETGGPTLGDPFGMIAGDARLWAAAAPPHELVAFTLAGLERLPKAHLSNPARKRAFKGLWGTFTDTERASFIATVAKKGGK